MGSIVEGVALKGVTMPLAEEGSDVVIGLAEEGSGIVTGAMTSLYSGEGSPQTYAHPKKTVQPRMLDHDQGIERNFSYFIVFSKGLFTKCTAVNIKLLQCAEDRHP